MNLLYFYLFFLAIIVIGWLQSYYCWVEPGTFVLKKKIRLKWLKFWKIENNYTVLTSGRHYLIPFFNSIVTDSFKKVFSIPNEKKQHSITSLQCNGIENISFTLSISFQFCVKDSTNFLNYISSSNCEKNIDVILKKQISDITTKACKNIQIKNYKDIKQNIINYISTACKNQAKSTYIDITDVDINSLHLTIDPEDNNIMNTLTESYMKNFKPDEYKANYIKFIKEIIEQSSTNNEESKQQYNITFQLPSNPFSFS